MKLSIVTTLYKSEPYLDEFYQRIVKAAAKQTSEFEIIFVNDGSPDNSLQKVIGFHENDKRVKIVDLSRNFGHHKAIMTGLRQAKGDKVFLIDCDLEEPPELLNSFFSELNTDDSLDAVYGVQKKRKGGLFEKVSGYLYYKVVNALVEYPIPQNFLTVRLMSKTFVDELTKYEERALIFTTLISHTGFNTKAIEVDKGHKGETSYTLSAKLKILENTVTSSSAKPLWMIFHFGAIITISSFFVMAYFLYRKVTNNIELEGWTSLIVSIWFIGGMLMLSVGVVGIYLSKVFIEVKQRPIVNVRKIYDKNI